MEYVSVSKTAKIMKVTNQAVYHAIGAKKIMANRVIGKWKINRHEIEKYIKNKRKREFSTFNGKPKFDKAQGELSVNEAADFLNMPVQTVYYLLRTDQIGYCRKGATYVMRLDDVEQYRLDRLQKAA
jgi:excisionase family DNA binding protein